ncbi:MAG: ribosomal protein L7/L12 [Myxococcota bacterium]
MAALSKARVIEYLTECSPDELDEIMEQLEERLGLERLAPPGLDWPDNMGEPLDMGMPEGFEVVMLAPGGARVQVMKALRASNSLSLKEAKALVEACPTVVRDGLRREEAVELQAALQAVGAEVQIR